MTIKKILQTGTFILVALIVLAIIYKYIIEPRLSGSTAETSEGVPLCSKALIENKINELAASVPPGLKARTGRAADNIGACSRVNCSELQTICRPPNKKAALIYEEFANTTLKTKYPMIAGNKVGDARGNQTKLNVPEDIYWKIYDETKLPKRKSVLVHKPIG